jgi:arsenate reductase-like glutaredoxin family protein
MDLSLALGVLKEALTLWNHKESTKYLERVIKLEKDYYEELNKPLDDRSDYKLDSIMLELTIISRSFVMYPGKNRS